MCDYLYYLQRTTTMRRTVKVCVERNLPAHGFAATPKYLVRLDEIAGWDGETL